MFASEVDNHAKTSHGPYQCALKPCNKSEPGGFPLKRLREHLHAIHSFMYYQADIVLYGRFGEPKDSAHYDQAGYVVACPNNHCADAYLHFRIENHEKSHGYLECGLGACQGSPSSKFTSLYLDLHLIREHGLDLSDAAGAASRAGLSPDKTVHSFTHPVCSKSTNPFLRDCNECQQRLMIENGSNQAGEV
jgi:hypothetical protein